MRYAENPNLNLEVVTTISGVKEYRHYCRSKKREDGTKEYYIKNVDIFFIEGTWYILRNKKIAFDNETKKMVIISKSKLINGVIGFDEKGNLIKGLYSQNPYKNCNMVFKGSMEPCQDYSILPDTYKFNPNNGVYVVSSKEFIINTAENAGGVYSIEDDRAGFDAAKKYYDENKMIPSKYYKGLSKYLGNITYGIELECIRGHLPKHLRCMFGLVVCRDGSLKDNDNSIGPEYVTVPLSGAKGLQNIDSFCTEISKTNITNTNCALHIHIGNIRKDRDFLVALYKLAVQIQNNMFSMFPPYKIDEMKYAGKEKNYCKKLKNYFEDYKGTTKEEYEVYINGCYKTLGQFLLGGNSVLNFNFNRGNLTHPERDKWRRSARYYWVNFMNMFFSSRYTIEFRLHTPTMNHQKIINWLFICNAIIKYAEQNTLHILKGEKTSITDILNIYDNPAIVTHLRDYYTGRVKFFNKSKSDSDYLTPNYFSEDLKQLPCIPLS